MNKQSNLRPLTGLKTIFWQLAATAAVLMLAGASFTGRAVKIDAIEAEAASIETAAAVETSGVQPDSATTVTVACSYDAAGRLIKIEYKDGKGIRYQYDKAGNLIRRQPY